MQLGKLIHFLPVTTSSIMHCSFDWPSFSCEYTTKINTIQMLCASLFHIYHHSLLLEGGYKVDVVFTSRLKRAIRSSWLLLRELNEVHLPVFKSWRLNERMYGALTGLSKTETAERLGAELVQEW